MTQAFKKPVAGQHHTPEFRRFVENALANLAEGDTPSAWARRNGINENAAQRIAREIVVEAKPLVFPDFVLEGDEHEPVEAILQRQKEAFERKAKAAAARKWFSIKVPETKPYGILWFGDPHIDNGGCNLPLLMRHIELAARPGIYGGNIGDTTDNWPWTGRLARLWADSSVTDKDAKRMAEWFMFDSGVRWLVWLLGNHDEWNGGSEFYRRLGAQHVPMLEWSAQFSVVHPNSSSVRIDASHGRKGSSIYNPAHATLRAAKFGEHADLFVTGHTHSFACVEYENADRQERSWLAQARGYKFYDHYAKVNNFAEYQYGSAILSVIDPETGRVLQCFSDPEEGADYLAFKRR